MTWQSDAPSAHTEWLEATWRQLDAAIEMLANAIRACPASLWAEPGRGLEFWRLAYHTIFALDYYVAELPEAYRPPAPFTLDESDPDAAPDRAYAPAELLDYLEQARGRGRARLAAMTPDQVGAPSPPPRIELTAAELLLYSLRHVQHGAAQLNLLLRQATGEAAPVWVRRSR
ncbi:MAG: DinB family protein [Gemmatimonadales bacterium]